MQNSTRRRIGSALRGLRNAAAALAVGLLAPAIAVAQVAPSGSAPGAWQYTGSIYLYLPSIGGTTSFPVSAGGGPIDVSADQILDRLKMTFMGSLDAHNGTWGVFTDLVYFDFGAAKSNSRDFTIGNIGIPAGTTANLDWDLKGTAWTLAGEYRVSSEPSLTVDLLAGTRLFDMRQRLRWDISGSLGSLDPSARSGSAEAKQSVWDGIVGVKGRYVFGANREWAVPFYLDVGTGQSDNTVQAAVGISYAFKWGELNTLWRYLAYDAKSGKAITDINFNGPQIGAVFRW